MNKLILIAMFLGFGFSAQAGVACKNRFGNLIYANLSGNKLKYSFSHPRDRAGSATLNGDVSGKLYFYERIKVRVIADKAVFEGGSGVLTYMRPTGNKSGSIPVRFHCP